VLSAKVKARFILHGKTREGHSSRGSLLPVELIRSSQSVIGHPDPTVDLCVVPVAPLLRAAQEIGREVQPALMATAAGPSDPVVEVVGPSGQRLRSGDLDVAELMRACWSGRA